MAHRHLAWWSILALGCASCGTEAETGTASGQPALAPQPKREFATAACEAFVSTLWLDESRFRVSPRDSPSAGPLPLADPTPQPAELFEGDSDEDLHTPHALGVTVNRKFAGRAPVGWGVVAPAQRVWLRCPGGGRIYLPGASEKKNDRDFPERGLRYVYRDCRTRSNLVLSGDRFLTTPDATVQSGTLRVSFPKTSYLCKFSLSERRDPQGALYEGTFCGYPMKVRPKPDPGPPHPAR